MDKFASPCVMLFCCTVLYDFTVCVCVSVLYCWCNRVLRVVQYCCTLMTISVCRCFNDEEVDNLGTMGLFPL